MQRSAWSFRGEKQRQSHCTHRTLKARVKRKTINRLPPHYHLPIPDTLRCHGKQHQTEINRQGSTLQGSSIIHQALCNAAIRNKPMPAAAVFVGLLSAPNHTPNPSSTLIKHLKWQILSLQNSKEEKRGSAGGRLPNTFLTHMFW